MPNGINATGQIVGDYYVSRGSTHGFLYSGGHYTTLDDPLGITIAQGINDTGQIVGYYQESGSVHGFLYSGGQYTTLDDPLGTTGNHRPRHQRHGPDRRGLRTTAAERARLLR